MKKLLIIANSDSAIFKFRKELIEKLAQHFKIGLCIPFGEYMTEIQNDNYEFFNIQVNRHGMNPVEDMGLFFKYVKVIRRFKPVAVLNYTIKPNIYGSLACSMMNIPYLCNITGLGALENNKKLQPLLLALYRLALKKANTIFFQNNHGLQFFYTHSIASKEQYALIPGSGVNLERFKPLVYPKDNVVRYLFVARIIKEKGIEEFLSVAQRFKKESLSAEFHICGKCEQNYQQLLERLDSNGIIKYHGLVKDMRDMYSMSSCVVLPSYYPEGQSNVLLEGAASARALITTDHPGCREAVDNYKTGYIVRLKDSEDLYKKMKKYYDLPLADKIIMGKCGREKIEKEFDRNIVINSYVSKLKGLGLIEI